MVEKTDPRIFESLTQSFVKTGPVSLDYLVIFDSLLDIGDDKHQRQILSDSFFSGIKTVSCKQVDCLIFQVLLSEDFECQLGAIHIVKMLAADKFESAFRAHTKLVSEEVLGKHQYTFP